MFNLMLTFQGLCGFVPLLDQSMCVLLPNESSAFAVTGRPRPHVAVMTFDLSHVVGGDLGNLVGNPKVQIPLEQVDVWLLPGGELAQNCLQFKAYDPATDRNTLTPSDPDYYKSFYWVGSVECAIKAKYPGGGTVRSNLVDPNTENLSSQDGTLLAGRLFLNFGCVESLPLARRDDRPGCKAIEVVSWGFRPYDAAAATGSHQQFLASEIVLQAQVDADNLVIAFTQFDGRRTNLVLEPVGFRERSITIAVLNEESDTIVGKAPSAIPAPIILNQSRIEDRIFESFYGLTMTTVPAQERAIPLAVDYHYPAVPVQGAPTLVIPPCSPGRLAFKPSISAATAEAAPAATRSSDAEAPAPGAPLPVLGALAERREVIGGLVSARPIASVPSGDERTFQVAVARQYLTTFGYLRDVRPLGQPGGDQIDPAIPDALKTFQALSGLPPTGELDPMTLRKMRAARCKLLDVHLAVCRIAAGQRALTYALGSPPQFFSAKSDPFDEIRRAMRSWEAVAGIAGGSFNFQEVQQGGQPDVQIGWGSPGLASSVFDIVAWADLPGACAPRSAPPQQLALGTDQSWCIGSNAEALDVYSVALHELGHILGLQHSGPGSIMYWDFSSHPVFQDVAGDPAAMALIQLYAGG
jgi:Matrixin/Putative peptidoglycan binding domain